jgi:hypothetical protein
MYRSAISNQKTHITYYPYIHIERPKLILYFASEGHVPFPLFSTIEDSMQNIAGLAPPHIYSSTTVEEAIVQFSSKNCSV